MAQILNVASIEKVNIPENREKERPEKAAAVPPAARAVRMARGPRMVRVVRAALPAECPAARRDSLRRILPSRR